MNKLNKLVTNYPVELTPEEVGNLSLTLSAVRTAKEDDKTYTGEGFVTVNNTNNTISLTTEANEKLNQPIPTKVSDLTDSANYQTTEGMNDYLTKTSASENLAPLSVTADIESLKNVSGDFSLYYNKNETSSKNELSSEFVKYVTTTEFNGVNVDVSTLKSASSEWNKVGDKLDTTSFSAVSGNFLTAAPENMATTGDVAELAQTISETYQIKGDYLTTADSSNFYPSNNPSGFITGVDLSNYYNKNETSSKEELDTAFGSKQDNLTNEQLSAISSVSSIKGTILTGDSNIRATSAEDGNNIKWILELTAQPVVTDTTLSGYDGIVATKDSTVSSQWNVGIEQAYKEQIEAVSSKLTQDVADTLYAPISVIEDVGTLKTASAGWNKVSDKLDTTAFSTVSGNFLTAHQDISNKLDTSAFSTVSATFLTAHQDISNKLDTTSFSAVSGNFLTDDDLNSYATKIDLENTSGKLLTTAQYKTDSATFLTAHQNLDAYATKEYANNASANALSQAKTWVESQNYLKEVPNTYATKTDLNTASSTLTGVDNALSGHINYVSAHTITSLDNYYTKTQVDSTFASATQLNNYLTTSQYNTDSGTFALKTEIPKTVSQLTDSGNYYQKTDTSSKTELTNALNTKVDKPSQTGKLVYDGDNNEWVTLPEGTTTIVQGQGSVTSNYDASGSTYTVSLLASAENALNKVDDKIDTTAVAQTYQTKADMTNYLTTSVASTAYQPIGDYATTSDISDMATQTWVGQQGFYTKASGDNDYAPKTITATVNTLTAASAGWNEVTSKLDSSVASTTYQTKEDMNGYLTKSEASTTYQPTGNYLVANDITGKLDKSIYSNASGNWENTYNTVKQYSAAGTWLTAHQSLTNYYTKSETSGAGELSTEFAKYVTSSTVTTQDTDYVMTTTGWKELTLPGGGMTQVIHDETLTGQGNADNSKLGLAQTAYNAITSVSSKLDTSTFSTVSSTFLTKSSADNDYAPISITTTVNTLTDASAGWNEVSAKLGTAQYATDSAKFVTSSSNTITGTKQYALTTAGWAEVSTPTIPDITATSGISADGFSIGLTNTAIGAITSVSSKVDIPDTTQTDLNNNYLIYSTLTDPGATTGWMPLSANYYSKSESNGIFVATANIDNTTLSGDGKSSDTKLGVKTDVIATKDYVNSSFLPLSGGTVSGGVIVSSSGTCLLSVGTETTLMGQSRVVNIGDTTAIGTNWLGISQSNQGFLKYVNGGNVGDLKGTSIQINFAPDGANSYGNITVNSQDNMSKVINVPTASYNSMSSFDSTNGPNYMLRKTASGFDIGAAVINVTELPQQIEANAYYFVYDT